MGYLDNYNDENKVNCLSGADEDKLLYESVICGDHELLYLDTYLRELFAPKAVN